MEEGKSKEFVFEQVDVEGVWGEETWILVMTVSNVYDESTA